MGPTSRERLLATAGPSPESRLAVWLHADGDPLLQSLRLNYYGRRNAPKGEEGDSRVVWKARDIFEDSRARIETIDKRTFEWLKDENAWGSKCPPKGLEARV